MRWCNNWSSCIVGCVASLQRCLGCTCVLYVTLYHACDALGLVLSACCQLVTSCIRLVMACCGCALVHLIFPQACHKWCVAWTLTHCMRAGLNSGCVHHAASQTLCCCLRCLSSTVHQRWWCIACMKKAIICVRAAAAYKHVYPAAPGAAVVVANLACSLSCGFEARLFPQSIIAF